MDTFELTVESSFDAAHFLPKHTGQCKNMHGHTWRVAATWISGTLGSVGYAADFSQLKLALREVTDELDHDIINEHVTPPSAEKIAQYIFDKLGNFLCTEDGAVIALKAIEVWESPTTSVKVTRDA